MPGYLKTKAEIKSLTNNINDPEYRFDGLAHLLSNGNESDWYIFVEASSATADDENVLISNDNPLLGRWHKSAGVRSTGFGYTMLCTSGASVPNSGKAIEFYAPQTNLELVVQVGFNMVALANIALPVYIHRWSVSPISGAQFVSGLGYKEEPAVIKLPLTGGRGRLNITSNFPRITAGVKKSNGLPDTPFILLNGNTITLLGV